MGYGQVGDGAGQMILNWRAKTVPLVQFWNGVSMRKGAATRERILEIAEAAVLAKGFGATSIDEVIAEAGITKSGFFYHFKDKNELAHDMVRRYVETNDRLFDEIFGRGRELSDDPLQAFLIGLKLLAEIMARSAQRPSRLPDRQHLLSGATVRSRDPPSSTQTLSKAGMHASSAISKRSPRSIRRASRWPSQISPTCSHASSTAASSCRRRSTIRVAWSVRCWPFVPSSNCSSRRRSDQQPRSET